MEKYPLYALNFDGTVNAEVNHGNVLNLGVQNFSVDFYLYFASLPVAQHSLIAKKVDGSILNIGYQIGITTIGLPQINISDGVTRKWFNGLTNLVGRWHHVAYAVDRGGNGILYVDGILNNTGDMSAVGNIDNALNFYLGRVGFGFPLTGVILLPKLYIGYLLSAAEVSWNLRNPMNPTRTGLALWLPMIEGQGATVNDYSGNGYNGTLGAGTSWRSMMLYEALADAQRPA